MASLKHVMLTQRYVDFKLRGQARSFGVSLQRSAWTVSDNRNPSVREFNDVHGAKGHEGKQRKHMQVGISIRG